MQFKFQGLTDTEVKQSRKKNGTNVVTIKKADSFWDKLIGNFKDPIIIILVIALIATTILAILGYAEWYEGAGIAIAVIIATMVATFSEYKNEAAFQQLLEKASLITIKVFRNNKLVELKINALVVDDYLLLQAGDTVPADGYLIAGQAEVNEAALTGESETLKKNACCDGQTLSKNHLIQRACLIEAGEVVMKVTAVGDKTEYGQSVTDIVNSDDRLSPLQNKLTLLGKKISLFAYVGGLAIAIAFMFKHIFLDYGTLASYLQQVPKPEIIHNVVQALILAIIIIVVAVPEGLPMMIAIVLSLNMHKLLQAKVLVRKLLGIETAGSLAILFLDKTGTLTEGKLSVAEIIGGNQQKYLQFEQLPKILQHNLAFALRNNTSAVIDASDIKHPKLVGADRTEQALLHALGSKLADEDVLDIVDLIPFTSVRKFSAISVRSDREITLVKGAPEILLEQCAFFLNEDCEKIVLDKDALLLEMKKLSDRAMRLIAVAITAQPIKENKNLPEELVLLAMLGLRDNLRDTAAQSVKRAQDAGIHTVMITGDAKDTARAIAEDVGLIKDKKGLVLTSGELSQLSDNIVKQMLPDLYVIARASPTDKSRLVKLAKELGWVTGMTGDGINDAAAIKNADVGFAMGSGTELTKEASDIVVLNDNFYSITQAVLYGRTLFKSIRKFLIFQLTVNLSAILLAFIAPFMGYDLPLTMIQLLWINLIMDTLAALAFSGEAAVERYLHETPISRDAPLINGDMWSSILTNGISATVLSLIFLTYSPIKNLFHNEAAFLTAFFAFFVFLHNFNKFNARTESLNLFDHLLENKNFLWVVSIIFTVQVIFTYLGGEILRTVAISAQEWLWVLLFSVIIIPIDLMRKLIRNLFFGNPVKN
jgi:calcium-translocating P-type ATPase